MFEKVKVNKTEFLLTKISTKQKSIENRMEFISNRSDLLAKNLRKVFAVWNNFFKGLAVVFSVGITTAVTIGTRHLYLTNGKWPFSTIVIGTICYLIVNAVLIWVLWALINTLLTEKVNNIFLGTEKETEEETETTEEQD